MESGRGEIGRKVIWSVFAAVLSSAIGIIFQRMGLGEGLVMYDPGRGVIGMHWSKYLSFMPWISLSIGAAIYVLYIGFAHKSVALTHFRRVFDMRKPWRWGFYAGLVLVLCSSMAVGLGMVSDRSFPTVIAIIVFSLTMGIIAGVFYWILTLFYSPSRVKYVPPLRGRILGVFGKTARRVL